MARSDARTSWLQQTLAWSNSWPSWRERLIGMTFLGGAAGLIYLGIYSLALWQTALALVLYALALTLCTRQGWLLLFGPVLFYDMVRTSRRSRYLIMRLLYACLLLSILSFMYLTMIAERALGDGNNRENAMLAQIFFSVFMLVQLAIVTLLTPAYVAGAIAEEKERKTLEFLLATDLSNREIVLSKLLSRLANMTLLLLTGLPILSMLQFVGGVDQELMLAGFAGTGLTMLGIASLSILLSTLFKKPRDAIALTYLLMVAYVSLATVGMTMDLGRHPMMSYPIWYGEAMPTYRDASNVLNAGNPIATLTEITMAIEGTSRTGGRTSLAAELPGILTGYAWFHLTLALVCIVWSVLRLRAIALKQTAGGTAARIRWWERYRTPVGELPMLWKEFNIEGGMKWNWLTLIAVIVLVLLTVGSGILVISSFIWSQMILAGQGFQELSQDMNIWFRIAGTGMACLLLLNVAVRASTSITSERERDTLDALITTPLSGEAMLAAKVLGSLTGMRFGGIWISAMLIIAIFTGGIHLLAVPIFITAWFVYALFFALVGTWFSLVSATSMRATVYTVLTTLLLGGGHWIVTGMCCFPLYTLLDVDHPGNFPDYFIKFQAGMTPPFVLGWCSYSWEDLSQNWRSEEFYEYFIFCIFGIFLWAIACPIFWFGLLVPRFRHLTRREDLIYQ